MTRKLMILAGVLSVGIAGFAAEPPDKQES